MQHITGISRQQLQISSLEDKIADITKKTKTKAGVVAELQAKALISLKTAFYDLITDFLRLFIFYKRQPKTKNKPRLSRSFGSA